MARTCRKLGFYINKLIYEGAILYEHNLENLHYRGPADLLEATRRSPHVPGRLSTKTTASTWLWGSRFA